MTYIYICLVAYLLGSIPFGLILTRVAGLGDIRDIGSGNIGATNVLRTGKKSIAALTLILDALKGTVAVLIALFATLTPPGDGGVVHAADGSIEPLSSVFYPFAHGPQMVGVVALLALIGHMYPIWLKFKGGKGVATALGIWLALSPSVFLCMLVTWLTGAYLSKLSSFGALAAMAVLPVLAYLIVPDYLAVALLTMALVVWRHRGNVSRLLAGTEPKIGAA